MAVTFQKAKKKREELQLPILHFNVADDWIDKLGTDAFTAWLKFYSWCDRTDDERENDYIPSSFKRLMARLGVGSKKFYNSIIRPLWNYGLIDVFEYEKSKNEGQKPMNIIVYEYPQNDRARIHEPLEKVRNYDSEYKSNARTFAKMGGRKNKGNKSFDGFLEKQGGVSLGNRGGFHEETGGGFTQKPNNVSNSISNVSKSSINDSNLNLNTRENKKVDIYEVLWDLDLPKDLKHKIKIKMTDNQFNHLSVQNLIDLQDAYHHQIQKDFIKPDTDMYDDFYINDYEFSDTMVKMLEKVNKIDNMKGLVKNWVQNRIQFKMDEPHFVNTETYQEEH